MATKTGSAKCSSVTVESGMVLVRLQPIFTAYPSLLTVQQFIDAACGSYTVFIMYIHGCSPGFLRRRICLCKAEMSSNKKAKNE
jgi:hypothetical protein